MQPRKGAPITFKLLGTAAGGGLPQWNCHCPNCAAVREGALPPRQQVSAAFSPDGAAWYLINATPDIAAQLTCLPLPLELVRRTPIAGVLLTDGELDHTLGLLHLREGADWTLYAAAAVQTLLEGPFPVLPMLRCYVAGATLATLSSDKALTLGQADNQVCVHVIETGRDLPRYAGSGEAPDAVVALRLETRNGSLMFAPGVSRLTPELFQQFEQADIVLFDGTLFKDDELLQLGIGQTTAKDMGHVPMSGADGSAAWLAALPARVKRYVHINNTNPALVPDSEARCSLQALGLDLAEDGWQVQL